ncbi:MAG: Hsp33 family molecular chaperone HslO [Deltaproteobacteria bacterium]|nr:Hsp33 family molecular chaperone HslO [Deltaproteobacteria bacterium]
MHVQLRDRVVRAITDDDAFRIIAASTTGTLRQAFAAQAASGATARHFGNLLTGTILVRETMSPHHRVQAVLHGVSGTSRLVADTHPDGATRGLVHLAEGARDFRLGPGCLLQVVRSLASGKLFQGTVQTPPPAAVSSALMAYLQKSERVVCVIATGQCWRGADLVLAGGYVVQLLPGAPRGPLAEMTERLEALAGIDQLLEQTGTRPERLIAVLLGATPFATTDERPVCFGCQCNEEAVVAAVASLRRDQIAEMLRAEDAVELCCGYCRKSYRVGRGQLDGLLREC